MFNRDKVKFIRLVLFFFAAPILKTETPDIFDIWEGVILQDFDYYSAQSNLITAQLRDQYKNIYYAPSLSFTENSDFEKFLTTGASLDFILPGDFHFGTSANYSMYGLDNMSQGLATQSFNLGLSISQSLKPYWFSGSRDNPSIMKLQLDMQLQENNLDSVIMSLLIQSSEYLLRLRQNERQIKFLEMSIDYQKELLVSMKVLKDQGLVSSQDIWEQERSLWEDELSLMQNKETLTELQLSLIKSCGLYIENSLAIILPPQGQCDEFKEQYINVNNIDLARLKLQESQMYFTSIQREQSQAPSITVSFNPSWSTFQDSEVNIPRLWLDNDDFNWSVSMTLNASPWLSRERKRDRALYRQSINVLEKERESVLHQLNSKIRILELNRKRLITQKQYLEEAFWKAQNIQEDTRQLLENGSISQLELKQAALTVIERKNAYDEVSDTLWYYEYLLIWYVLR